MRRRRLAFVEVKRRATRLEAEAALSPRQAGRIAQAAEFWVSRNTRYRDHERGLDAVFVMPRRLPVHLPNALHLAPPAGPFLALTLHRGTSLHGRPFRRSIARP